MERFEVASIILLAFLSPLGTLGQEQQTRKEAGAAWNWWVNLESSPLIFEINVSRRMLNLFNHDADNDVAAATSYDVFGRPLLVKAAEGISGQERRTATEYSDVARRVVVRADLTATGDGKLVSIQRYDHLAECV